VDQPSASDVASRVEPANGNEGDHTQTDKDARVTIDGKYAKLEDQAARPGQGHPEGSRRQARGHEGRGHHEEGEV